MTLQCPKCLHIVRDEQEADSHSRVIHNDLDIVYNRLIDPNTKNIEQAREDELKLTNGIGKEQVFQNAIECYGLYLEEGDYEKYQPMCYSHTDEEKLEALIYAEELLMKGLWIKNRFTKYTSEEWGYLSTLFHKEWANLELLHAIKKGHWPKQDIDVVFKFSNNIRSDHTSNKYL